MSVNEWLGPRRLFALIVACLFAALALQLWLSDRRQSVTWDEDDHVYAGYMSLKTLDFGLNPEHPPLVKMVAALPLLGMNLKLPAMQNRYFKTEAFLDGREFLFRNDADAILARARAASAIFTFLCATLMLLAGCELFGRWGGAAALCLFVFDPNLLAHGAYVTTDMAVSCFYFAAIYAFLRYVKAPSWPRLAWVCVGAGLAMASKHSGILIFPMLALLIVCELSLGPERGRELARKAARLTGALAVVVVVACAILWAFYGFRYAARPEGLVMNPTLAQAIDGLPASHRGFASLCARFRLLPESYIYGLVDVQGLSLGMPSYIFGKVYAHGVWHYFPCAYVIKATIGSMLLLACGLGAWALRRICMGRELLFFLLPCVLYTAVAMSSGVNIGARHILPLFVISCLIAAGFAVRLVALDRRWLWGVSLLLAMHLATSLRAAPVYIPYANELWGGPANTYKYLTDSNVDWGQQLKSVRTYLDARGVKNCWFAYFADGVVDTHYYGVPCRSLPTADTLWVNQIEAVPLEIDGPVLISAGDLNAFEFGDAYLNPYKQFMTMRPTAVIDHGVFVFDGHFRMATASALSHTQIAWSLMAQGRMAEALSEAQYAAAADPGCIMAQTALGDVQAALGRRDEARKAYLAARSAAGNLQPEPRDKQIAELDHKLSALAQ